MVLLGVCKWCLRDYTKFRKNQNNRIRALAHKNMLEIDFEKLFYIAPLS